MQDDPNESIGFLMSDVARLMRREFNRRVQHIGLTEAQWRVIVHLYRHEGLNQAALAQLLEVQPISLGRLIDRMEQAGFVERRPDPTDRRAVRLYLTDKVAPLIETMTEEGSVLREQVVAGLSAQQQNALIKTLSIMRANLNREASCDD